MLPSVLKSWRVPTLQLPIKVLQNGFHAVSRDNLLAHIQRFLTADIPTILPNQAVSVRPSADLNLKGPEFLFFWEKLKKCFGFGAKKGGKGKGKKMKKQSCQSKSGKCANQKSTCMKKKNEDKCKSKQEQKPKPECKDAKKKDDTCKKKVEKKADPCKKKEEKKADPCKKQEKKADPCKKDEKKADPCKKKEEKKADPCKKKDDKKVDPCKKDEKKSDPCKKKADPCKKKEEKKADPCKKKDDKKFDPCKKKEEKKPDPCKKDDKKKEDPCKKKDDPCKKKDEKKSDPCKKKDDPCKKKDEKKSDPCKKKDDPCKKKEEKKSDPCKKKEDPCKKKDPCGDKFATNESSTEPILLFSLTRDLHKKEGDEVRETCKDPCEEGACDVLPGLDEPCADTSWKVKVNPCRQRGSGDKRKECTTSPTTCIVESQSKKDEEVVKQNDCGISANPCGKKVCPNRCEWKKKTKCSSMTESLDWSMFNGVTVLTGQAIGILSLVNFASQKGPINQPPTSGSQAAGNTPAPGSVAQKVSGIVGRIKELWNGPEATKRKQQPRTSNVPGATQNQRPPRRTPGGYPTKQRFEGVDTELPGLPTDGFVFAQEPLGLDDFEKCEDRIPPCPLDIETLPCPKPIQDCQKTADMEIWSDIDESYGYEKFPFKIEKTHGNALEVASLRPDDPYSNGHL